MSVSQEIATRAQGPAVMVRQYEAHFTDMLPSHIKPDAWMRVATRALRDDNLMKVAQQNPQSLVTALLECARLGHEPASDAFYLVPIGGSVEGWESYRGKIERIYRAGAVESVIAEVVYKNDEFTFQPGVNDKPVHRINWDSVDRGEMRLAYSYAVMKGGAISKVVVMNKTQIELHKKESKTSGRADSLWNKWPEQAWLKTVVHQLEKWVPTSAEYLREQLRVARDVQAENTAVRLDRGPQPATVTADVVTGEMDPDNYHAAMQTARDELGAEAVK